jgi:cell division protein FtsW
VSFSRADRSRLVSWWFTVDKVLLSAIAALIVIGLMLSLAASPAVAIKKHLPTFYFFQRHLVYSAIGLGVIIVLSFCRPETIRRIASLLLLGSFAALVWVYLESPAVNGARRWLFIEGFSVQPSEFAKPAFVVVSGWLLAEAHRRSDVPALPLAVILLVAFASLLMLQPDFGQTLLIGLVWGLMYLLAGLPLAGAGVLAGAGLALMVTGYVLFAHVRERVARFLAPSPEENSQLARAMQSFTEGGFFGRGPGEGTIKTKFPDAHTDFIFAVVAEEYGVIACLGLLALFGFIVVKALAAAGREPHGGNRLAVQGLALMFGLQALINMGVNAGLLPAKGMTLPFISAGGSSILSISITLGMLLALTRRRADPTRLSMPKVVARAEGLDISEERRGQA